MLSTSGEYFECPGKLKELKSETVRRTGGEKGTTELAMSTLTFPVSRPQMSQQPETQSERSRLARNLPAAIDTVRSTYKESMRPEQQESSKSPTCVVKTTKCPTCFNICTANTR
jgi:hypothetical protein